MQEVACMHNRYKSKIENESKWLKVYWSHKHFILGLVIHKSRRPH